MKKYLSGSWSVFKNYLFVIIIFFIFIISLYSKASWFSIPLFILMSLFIYSEMSHKAGVDKRRYGSIKLIDSVLYALIAIAPMIIIQIIISSLQIESTVLDVSILKANLTKAVAAPMLFIAKAGGYSIYSYALAWSTIVLMSFLGYYAGSKGFDLNEYVRQLLGLKPKQKTVNKNKRRF